MLRRSAVVGLRTLALGLTVALPVVTLGLALSTGPASAHATLVSTTPTDGAVVPGPVHTVSATFDEAVGVSLDSLRVYAPDGTRVDTGGTRVAGDPATIQTALSPRLADGTYTVAWHVVSADTHPAQGAFTFSIGHRSSHVSTSTVSGGASGPLTVLYAADRFAGYLGFVVAAGGAVFVALFWPGGAHHRTARRLLAAAWLVTVASSLLQLPLQGALAAERGLGALLDPQVSSDAFDSRVGRAVVVRLLALGILALLWQALRLVPRDAAHAARAGAHGAHASNERDTSGDRIRHVMGALFLLGTGFAAVTWSMAGHSATGTWWPVALAADVVHLEAAAVWLGGLAVLLGVVLRAPSVKPVAARTAATRFSPAAVWCVGLIAVTGTFQAWRNTRSWAALIDTRYGVLVCLKVALLGLLVLLGLQARRVLGERPFGRPPAHEVDLVRLRRGVAVEAVAAILVLGVTAVLVQTPTARESYHPVATATQTFDTGKVKGTLTAVLTPARLGTNHVRLRLTTTNGPYHPVQLTATLTQDAAGIGPLPLALHRTSQGTYQSAPISLGFRGTWTLTAVIRSDAFDEATITVGMSVS